MYVEIIPDKKIYMSGMISTIKKIPLPGEAVNYLVAQSNHIFSILSIFMNNKFHFLQVFSMMTSSSEDPFKKSLVCDKFGHWKEPNDSSTTTNEGHIR